ncbi:MAG: sensor histidine kinase [Rubrobacteraceae bacterium]
MSALLSHLRKLGGRPARRDACVPQHTNNVWNRWHRAMHFVFYGLLAFSMIPALLDGPVNGPYTWRYAIVVCGLALLLGGWYWLLVVTPRVRVEERPLRALGYYVVALVVFAGLISVHPAFMFLSFVFYWHTFSLLPTRWAIPGTAVLSVLLVWVSGGSESLSQLVSAPGIFIFLGSLVVAGVLSLFIGSIIDQSEERQRLIEELDSTRAELAKEERRAGMLEERGRLAREIHDTLAQGFISVVTHLEAADAALSADEESGRWHLDQARHTARDNLVEARRLVRALQPELLESSSLPEALERLAQRWAESSGARAGVSVTGDERQLPQELQVTLFRVAQEAFSNARKHAGASRVDLTLSYIDDLVVMDVQDDGAGFDPAVSENGAGGGFGLRAMRERIERLDGSLLIESKPGEGTTLVATLPVSAMTEGTEPS